MAIPSQKKTFGLETCRDLLEKLTWEYQELTRTPPHDVTALIYRAFNGFVTAFHIADWVWEAMTETQRDRLRAEWDVPLLNKSDFVGELRRRERCFALCREIATASKHFVVNQTPDDTVDAVTSLTVSLVTAGGEPVTTNEGEPVGVFKAILKVIDGEQERFAVDVLEILLYFWSEFIYERDIGAIRLTSCGGLDVAEP